MNFFISYKFGIPHEKGKAEYNKKIYEWLLNNKWQYFKTYAYGNLVIWPLLAAKFVTYNFFEKYDDTLIFDAMID